MVASEEVEVQGSSETVDQDVSTDTTVGRDPLYLFACHLLWHRNRDLKAYQELIAALDDANPSIRDVAQALLHRSSPRPNHDQRTTGRFR